VLVRFLLVPCLATAVPAAAQDLTLADAVARATERHPALRAELHVLEAAEAKASLDALAPSMTFGGELENVGGTGAVSGVHGAEATFRVGRVFELGGKRDARRALGAADVDRQRARLELRRLDLVTEVTRRFVELLERQALLTLAEGEIALAKNLRDAVAYRVERAASPESDLELAEIAVARAELELEHAVHELASARVALAVTFDVAVPDFARAAGDLEPLPPTEPLATWQERVTANAEQHGFAFDAAQLEAQRRLARTVRAPDVTTTLGVRRLEALDDQALVLSVSVPFGTATRATLAEARVDAEKEALDERRRAAQLESWRSVFATFQELLHAKTEFDKLGSTMIPAAEAAVKLTQRGYDEARFSFVQLTQARTVAVELRKQRLAAAARYHRLRAELERATAPLDGATP